MKRVYEKPSLAIELFETESILVTSNVFADATATSGGTLELGNNVTINLATGQVLESIDYKSFTKKSN